MRFSVPLLLFTLFFSITSLAQDARFVGGTQELALRGGAGNDYPIVYRGIAPGSRVIVSRTSDDGLWADITTESGVTGWIHTQDLIVELTEQPGAAALKVVTQDPLDDSDVAMIDNDAIQSADAAELLTRINAYDAEFNAVAQELHHLKQVSGKAVQLDIDNRRLVEESENLRSEVEMLQAENQRLVDKLDSEDFMNGALAVLLGVIIALVAPRLVPQRRKTSSW